MAGTEGTSLQRIARRRRAMTLVEVLVASVLLGVGVAGLMFAASLGLRNQTRLDQRTAGMYLAAEKLAEIDAVGPRMWVLTQPVSGMERRGAQRCTWTAQIEAMTEGELYNVRVTVSWMVNATKDSVTLETLLNDYGAVTNLTYEQQNRSTPLEAGQPAEGR